MSSSRPEFAQLFVMWYHVCLEIAKSHYCNLLFGTKYGMLQLWCVALFLRYVSCFVLDSKQKRTWLLYGICIKLLN